MLIAKCRHISAIIIISWNSREVWQIIRSTRKNRFEKKQCDSKLGLLNFESTKCSIEITSTYQHIQCRVTFSNWIWNDAETCRSCRSRKCWKCAISRLDRRRYSRDLALRSLPIHACRPPKGHKFRCGNASPFQDKRLLPASNASMRSCTLRRVAR